jgi:UTP--glucose-1-phosphate uridylyltransferase
VLGSEGRPVPLIRHLTDELLAAGVTQVALVVNDQSYPLVSALLADRGAAVHYVWQKQALGFGHALCCAAPWVGSDSAVVQVCDHVFLSSSARSCPAQVIEAYEAQGASVCAVQRLREVEVPRVGVVSGQRQGEGTSTYLIDAFLEKPTVTKAELLPPVPGLAANEYLCSAGLFVFSPGFFSILKELGAAGRWADLGSLAPALAELMRRETLVGLEFLGRRINLEEPLGLVRAQVAMGLARNDRDAVLALMLEESVRLVRP